VTAAAPQTPPAQQTQRKETQSVSVTEFEIVCYLANYEEIDRR